MTFCAAAAGCAGLPGGTAPAPEPPVVDSVSAIQAPTPRSEALLMALMALGVDYRDGGRSPVTGFDCSGLVAHVFEEAYGIRLPRNVRAQSEAGLPVSVNELEPGDLVFYDTLGRPYSHVGIYLGAGRFVHAPKSGSRVRVESLRGAYWVKRFNGARRIEPAL
ncbi:MAG: C40 family peptidase [Betaproteobacteria bacterium]|nr:C40 family peptidase [Betaproteobacteria bacterium]